MNKTVLFQALVGSRAHGLNDPDSDYDYRGVFIVPTVEILRLGANPKTTSWIEGDVDDTQWELGHFLHLATKCNPTILEAFVSPIKETTETGDALRALLPLVWNSRGVHDAFRGYSTNQRKKFLEDKDGRAWKYAVAYIRTLWMGTFLLEQGVLPINIQAYNQDMHKTLLKIRHAGMSKGDVVDIATAWEDRITSAYEKHPNKETDIEAVNDFLIETRWRYWKASEV